MINVFYFYRDYFNLIHLKEKIMKKLLKLQRQKNKRFYTLISYFTMVYLLTSIFSCSKEEMTVTDTNTEEEIIRVGAGINILTRATENGFEMNDSIGLFMVKGTPTSEPASLLPSGNYTDNALYRLTGLPDSWTTDKKYYYPKDGSLLDFYAYYPYQRSVFISGTHININTEADQSSYNSYTQSDFMIAHTKGIAKRATKVHLDFYHQLSQVTFILKQGIGITKEELKNAQISIFNAITDATYDLSRQTDTIPFPGSIRKNIIPYGEWSEVDSVSLKGKMAILIPQPLNTTTYLQIKVGERIYTYKPAQATYLAPGYSQEFIITINHTDLDIATRIQPWKTCPPIQGDAEEDIEEDYIVSMTTTSSDTISIQFTSTSEITVDWGDNSPDTNRYFHRYTDNLPTHQITLKGADTALISLICMEDSLTSLIVSPNKNLEILQCPANQLSSIDISQNKKLKVFYCDVNKLTNLDVSQNTMLEDLACGMNLLTDINLNNNILLKKFICNYNQLNNLIINNNPHLSTIFCSENPFLSDPSKLTEFANSLPQLSNSQQGSLYVGNPTFSATIKSICEAKNWHVF